MVKDKSSKPRNIFATANKYQDKIILLTFAPSALIFLSFIIIVLVGNPMITKAIFHNSAPNIERLINLFCTAIVFLMCAIFFLSIVASFIISHHMVGAIGRITRELNMVITGENTKTITCRPGDDLCRDLLKPINTLVKFYVENKKN